MRETVIRLQNIHKTYVLDRFRIQALKKVNLEVSSGDFTVIAGSSGSGKTTLLNLMGLLDTPTSGKMWIGDDAIPDSRAHRLYKIRRDRIGYVFQTFNLQPVLNVYENVEYPLILQSRPRRERRIRVESALRRTGLWERKRHRPRELSGGERQRVSIARAVVKNPDIVFADEPTANLDSLTAGKILEMMEGLNEAGVTFVFSSHDPAIIARARNVVFLRDGILTDKKGGTQDVC